MKFRPLRWFWGALGYLAIAVVSPLALVAAPLAAFLGVQRPGRRDRVVAGTLIALVLWGAAGPADGYAAFERAWVFVLCGGVVVALAARPPATSGFLGTALLALAIGTAAGALLMAATGFTWAELQWLAGRHFGSQARELIKALASALAAAPEATRALVDALEESALVGVRLASWLLPALVLLQSLAALAAAWTLYHLVAQQPQGAPLSGLRDFRFNDHLIWGVVLALIGLVVPYLEWFRALGGNLAAFFGGLYVVRGLAVALAFTAAGGIGGPLAVLTAVLMLLFLMPVAALVALALGVTDTWVDWRRLVRAARR